MATTTNFGWETPDDTDLVKDGAAAIRTLGQSIDTSMADLEGGTTGQILAKNSNTDMDFVWIANDQGDITEITAGTGISGGGTSGAVTITNSMATAIDAKGDLVAGTGADTFSRLAIGTNGQVLTADSTAGTGMKWATAGSAFNGASVYKTATQAIAHNTATTITFNAESYDTNTYHDNVTNNSRLTVPSTGYYLVNALVQYDGNSTGYRDIILLKNGSQVTYFARGADATTTGYGPMWITRYVYLAANDYLTLTTYQTSGISLNLQSGDTTNYFQIQYLGA
jgi:hypothetical protein